jgi:hypothetical protein
LFQKLGILAGPEERDERLPFPHPLKLVSFRTADFDKQIGRFGYGFGIGKYRDAGFGVGFIGNTGFLAGSGFNQTLMTEFLQMPRRVRRQRHPAFAVSSFP